MSPEAKAPPRVEARLKVTGAAMFAAEAPMEGMLHATLIPATIGKGAVTAVDAAAALGMPGVADVVSYDEAQVFRPSPNVAMVRDPVIHFPGQPVALLAAGTLQQALAAAGSVAVTYAAEPPVTAIDQALESAFTPASAGARAAPDSLRGDPAAALAEAEVRVGGRYETAVNNHHPMEPHAVVCRWEADDRVTVHTSTQAIFGTRNVIAHAFGLPRENVRVITRFLGGGFGCKGPLWWPYMMMALLAARRTGRPVRLELTRAQLFTLVGRRSETVQELELGAARDGRLTAIRHRSLAQTSTHAEYADPVCGVSRWLYACPNVETSHRLVRTNGPHPIPMRGPGPAPGGFALESALDELAFTVGVDPVALRLLNHADHDQDAGRPWSSNGLAACYRRGAEAFGWDRRPAPGAQVEGRWTVGWGMATACYHVHRQPCRMKVRLEADGALLIQCGTQDMGSGTYTTLAQFVAEPLGVPMERVTVELGDTELPEGPYSAGSMVTASIAPAAEMAVTRLKADIAALATGDPASPLAGLPPEDLVFEDGAVRSRAGNAGLPLTELLKRLAPQGLEAEGEAAAPGEDAFSAMGFGAVFAEVGVDRDLGEVRVRRLTAAYAAGRILNPLLAQSQYVGGLIGGIGMALGEKTVTDRNSGRILGDGFADYLIPVHADMPDFDVIMVEEDDPYLPGGVKGIGMLGSVGTPAAIANAVFHATGRRIRHLPIRIEDVIGEA